MALKHIGNRANGTVGLSEAERQAYGLAPHAAAAAGLARSLGWRANTPA